jgi:hypothetical protein
MSRTSQSIRGHTVYTDDGVNWFYEDTNEPYITDRPCKKCGLLAANDEPDPCLGLLPGVKFACCGHGGEGYIYFTNEQIIRFNEITSKT